MKDNKIELKNRKTLFKKKNKSILNRFKRLFITEKDNLNKSQKDFYNNSPKIKLGNR